MPPNGGKLQPININILQYDRNRTVGKDDNLVMEQVY